MDAFVGIPDGGSVRVKKGPFTGFVACFLPEFPLDARLRRFPGIQFSRRNFQCFLAESIPVLPDHEDFVIRDKRNHRRRFGVINFHPLSRASVTEDDFIKIG